MSAIIPAVLHFESSGMNLRELFHPASNTIKLVPF